MKLGALKTTDCMENMFMFLHNIFDSRIFFISVSWSVNEKQNKGMFDILNF